MNVTSTAICGSDLHLLIGIVLIVNGGNWGIHNVEGVTIVVAMNKALFFKWVNGLNK